MMRVVWRLDGWMYCSVVRVSCEPFHLRVLRLRAERYVSVLTLFPPRGFRRALSPRRVPSVRPLCLPPWASGVAPRLIRTARARATIVLK